MFRELGLVSWILMLIYINRCEASFLGSLSENITLTCPVGQTLTIVKADWGRDSNSMSCDKEFHYSGDCGSREETTQRVRELCNGNKVCNLTASTDTFKDPCPTVIKQLRVWYQCYQAPSKKGT